MTPSGIEPATFRFVAKHLKLRLVLANIIICSFWFCTQTRFNCHQWTSVHRLRNITRT